MRIAVVGVLLIMPAIAFFSFLAVAA